MEKDLNELKEILVVLFAQMKYNDTSSNHINAAESDIQNILKAYKASKPKKALGKYYLPQIRG